MYATKGYKLHMHYIIIQLHSQILIIVVIVAFTCCYDKTIQKYICLVSRNFYTIIFTEMIRCFVSRRDETM